MVQTWAVKMCPGFRRLIRVKLWVSVLLEINLGFQKNREFGILMVGRVKIKIFGDVTV